MNFIRAIVFFIIALATSLALAKEPPKIPAPLKPWVDWVLYDHEASYLCPPHYNDADKRRCSWPTELKLAVDSHGGHFEQQWRIHHDSWVTLPGSDPHWPVNIRVNQKPGLVVKKGGRPRIKLAKGVYRLSGDFVWKKIPEHLPIATDSALVSLTMHGKKADFPNIDSRGRLWFQAVRKKEEKIENRLQIQSYRLIEDTIPLRITLYMTLDVAGAAREVLLGPSYSPNMFIPLSLKSALPARIEQDGRIRMQVRPGRWTLELVIRHVGPAFSLTFNRPDDGFWPEAEIWSFSAQTQLRIVEIDGAPSIDPNQTAMPDKWRQYPAYRLVDAETLSLMQEKRGDPHPAPDQLSLKRNIWLRFDGSSYTVQDQITGKKSTNWRLEMNSPLVLGRVVVDGVTQFITQLEGSDKSGIELRKGLIQLSADSNYSGKISTLPAAGWDHDFTQVDTTLHLPPGYQLLHATGMDNTPITWVTRWTLLDLFVVLVFTIAAAKLYSRRLSLIAILTLVLIYHEPGAPRWIWPAILVGVALLRHLPEGRFKGMVKCYHVLTAVILVYIAIPFAIHQLRVGIYPQLEKPWQIVSGEQFSGRATTVAAMKKDVIEDRAAAPDQRMEKHALKTKLTQESIHSIARIPQKMKQPPGYDRFSSNVAQYDPTMINQTGPGLPTWRWNSIRLKTGPVRKEQIISLNLIGPRVNMILSFSRVGLLLILAFGLYGGAFRKGQGWRLPKWPVLIFIPVLCMLLNPVPGHATDLPSPALLEELQDRLLETEDCFPDCADVSLMHIRITPNTLSITLQVSSQIDAALPLPGSPKHWLPQTVLIDRRPAPALFKTTQGLWALIPAGNHEVVLSGKLPRYNTIQLPLPLKPHRVKIDQDEWVSEGVHADGTIDNQLQFKRISEQDTVSGQILDTGVLPPFVRVERTLYLGLVWKMRTRVIRKIPRGSAIVLDIPLLKGESIVTSGIKVNNQTAQINLDARTNVIHWDSALEKSNKISLEHMDTHLWTEVWQVDVSPIFHMTYEGIPVILHQQGNRWAPKWHPWPGESVALTLTRPAGVAGQTLTIDESRLEVRPGQRATDCKLKLSIRSSQGGRHTIVLPEDAKLQDVRIDGRTQPIRQEGRNVPLPINPGIQTVVLRWQGMNGICAQFQTPAVDLKASHVNTHIDVILPTSRWPIFVTGPQMGPAVLFWSVMLVIILAAFGLSRTGWTPLKFRHWVLLGIGLSQSHPLIGFMVAGWLIALDFRKRLDPGVSKRRFNVMQIGIVMLTFAALGSLVMAIRQGLLGHPDMNIVGNGSSAGLLRWYQDYNDGMLPRAAVFSIPMIWYRLAMLVWSLWIAFYLIKILKWGWANFTHPTLWSRPVKNPMPDAPVSENDA
ncbi:MAG: hypothetical protein JRH15_05510 [Deltaproteobacteria bacterium]|nr:hypothetical protein [Deltaproteobacteria bacterium]